MSDEIIGALIESRTSLVLVVITIFVNIISYFYQQGVKKREEKDIQKQWEENNRIIKKLENEQIQLKHKLEKSGKKAFAMTEKQQYLLRIWQTLIGVSITETTKKGSKSRRVVEDVNSKITVLAKAGNEWKIAEA